MFYVIFHFPAKFHKNKKYTSNVFSHVSSKDLKNKLRRNLKRQIAPCVSLWQRTCNVNHIRDQDTHTHRGQDGVPDGILRTRWTDEGNTWRPWRQCILPEYLRIHLWTNGPSIKCSRSVATVTYAYRVVGIMREQMSPKVKRL